ncbi:MULTISPECIES: ABC transporter ATP-binding protein [Thermomonospora]|uniref:ABC transporter related protein n=1 Tax=Thermomonospora curvata (strain ATCC 19995 / DSM 43183 / JCM 3096 / KCTC 9072 / NBRC 15933 / NCIMB 10081 / Henssen B9) TaxID=471852 RepID=D1A266_THECD|nr:MULTISPECIES: ABC transporter ATP-binding protein [Thermomonospora]ACY99719.1 ABC transporter related protein [Thermomonospora curvata DSM 43183]
MTLELRGITKRFGSLVANDGIDLEVRPGEIHCLLGENGAGKSTLMNVLYGLYQPDAGQILMDGRPLTINGPRDAIAAGIGMVHQHFMLIPVFTVAENVMLGDERTGPPRWARSLGPLARLGWSGPVGWLDRRRARRDVAEISSRYGLQVDPDALVADLPVGVQQRVEIIKALIRDARVLILDEPTAVLTPQETEELFSVMRSLRASGRSIVFITHKLKEVKAVADRITVIRRGAVVGTAGPEASERELAGLMVGRDVRLTVDKAPPAVPEDAEPAFQVRDLTVLDESGQPVVDGVSFDIRAGEILGIAGVQGNGQTELTEAILGLRPAAGGSIRLDGRELTGRSPRQVLRAGVGYIPEDRGHDALVADSSVAENLVLDLFDRPPFGRRGSMDVRAVRANAAHRVEEFDIRTSSIDAPVGTLSGGNQQKVVVAREMSRPLRLLVASQPTRGVDVGAMEFIHRRIVAERDQGRPVLIVSTELDEIFALADRIAVMYRGKIMAIVPPETSREDIGCLMAGTSPDAAGPPEGAADSQKDAAAKDGDADE